MFLTQDIKLITNEKEKRTFKRLKKNFMILIWINLINCILIIQEVIIIEDFKIKYEKSIFFIFTIFSLD